jgi:acyl dehydratase
MSVRELERAPNLPRLYGKAAITARGRRGNVLPDSSYELRDVAIERDHLGRYALVCGFRQSDALPATYPHILAFPAAVMLMVEPEFPFALPGLVHISNRIEQKRMFTASERLTLRVHAENLRDHPRGRQFDMITEVTVAGEPVWTESSTYLKRSSKPTQSSSRQSDSSPTGRGGQDGAPDNSPSPLVEEGWGGGLRPTAIWRIPRDIGRRYAAVSGDVNPIHLNPFVARLFGFRRAIAHGMWVKARCLAALEGRLPDALTAEVEFKSPLLLPSTVAFSSSLREGAWVIEVSEARSGRPHLAGRISGVNEGSAA